MNLRYLDIFKWIQWLVATVSAYLFRTATFEQLMKKREYDPLPRHDTDNISPRTVIGISEEEWKDQYMKSTNIMAF